MASNPGSTELLHIISFNCWGLKYLAKYRKERLEEIGLRLANAKPEPSIVGLQECWTQEDYRAIRRRTESVLPYGKFYYSGIFGGGLVILSKWPIEESSMIRYPLNGRPTAFFRGDWFVGKGVACARIRYGPGMKDIAEVFCTHLHAPYEREPYDSYICHRTAQAWEIAKLMRGASEKGHLVIGLGDFNMLPLSFAHRLITAHAPVQDVWRTLHPESSIGAACDNPEQTQGRKPPDIQYNIAENGTTCDSELNSWRWTKEQRRRLAQGENIVIPNDTPDLRAKRLDYIFTSSRDAGESLCCVREVRVGMTERHPSIGCSLSDHFSIEATLSLEPLLQKPNLSDAPAIDQSSKRDKVDEIFPATLSKGYFTSPEAKGPNWSAQSLDPAVYGEILTMISAYKTREQRQRRFRLWHFIISVIVSLGCFVAIWWSPTNYVSLILIVMSTFGFGTGIVDGLIGGLFVGSEIRALKEFEWEINTAKSRAREPKDEQGTDSHEKKMNNVTT
ncbi:phospholipase C type enzyme [Loxospora ochrophaea]|nr:phospholipase C type enzyme [Loxospora ochrophaea]